MENIPEKCPYCGSDVSPDSGINWRVFTCQTYIHNYGKVNESPSRSVICYERQVTQLENVILDVVDFLQPMATTNSAKIILNVVDKLTSMGYLK